MVCVNYKVCQVTIDDKHPWCVSSYDACQVTMKQSIWEKLSIKLPGFLQKTGKNPVKNV